MQPLQAIESYFLITALSGALEDSVGKTNALCQISKLLLHLECPSYAEVSMKSSELQKSLASPGKIPLGNPG